jgi:cell wall-associated NlpC family hydrolase
MSKVVEIASTQIGQGEKPLNTNKTKYGKWFGYDGVAWCGIFVSWCYSLAGAQLPKIGFSKGYAGCQTAVAYFRKNNRVTTNPMAGNIVFFDWNGDGRFDHTGIFVRWIEVGKTFESIEGNTAIGNDSNGGEVMLRSRKNINVLFVDPF